MSVIGSNILAGASGQAGYNLTNSLRFRESASARLTRTPASATNRRTYTISAWVKLGLNSDAAVRTIFCGGDSSTSASTHLYFYLNSLRFYFGGAGGPEWTTSQVFRDYSSWYHIVAAVDTTQATFGNRLKLYINGTEVTSWSAQGTGGNTAQNSDTQINSTSAHGIGSNATAAQYLYDGYMTEFNFIDGQQLTPASFGETSTSTGVWIPKKFSGTYGTNGFYLKFTDTTSTSTLGTDFSGNSNTWTVNNISLTAGSTYDSMTDVPTLTSATAANYAVMNPLDNVGTTVSQGNLLLTANSGSWQTTRSTFAMPSGSWYCELTAISGTGNGNTFIGIAPQSTALSSISGGTYVGSTSTSWAYSSNGNTYTNGSVLSATGTTFSANDVIGVSFTGSELKFYKNNTLVTTISSIPTGDYCITSSFYSSDAGAFNFGQRPFAYTPPTGFVRLNTFNLTTPTIGATAATTANKYMDATIWSGDNAASRAITNSGSMQPDWVWVKRRNGSADHALFDSVRGFGGNKDLSSNTTGAEGALNTSLYGFVSAANSTGFQLTAGSTDSSYTNRTGDTYVGWQWRASNTTPVSNTAGSITSTVSANTSAGFSVVTYTGTGANATVGHGLGVAPSMVIYKRRSATDGWAVYFSSIGAANNLVLQSTAAQQANGNVYWNSTAPTSTVFTAGTDSAVNASTATYVAYCFAPIAGYSAFGSYTGNGSTDGAFIYTGFRPKFVIIKSTGVEDWRMFDTSRSTYNIQGATLYPNDSAAENAGQLIDINSNGFKCRTTDGAVNGSGTSYIYMAFAESPFKYANAR